MAGFELVPAASIVPVLLTAKKNDQSENCGHEIPFAGTTLYREAIPVLISESCDIGWRGAWAALTGAP